MHWATLEKPLLQTFACCRRSSFILTGRSLRIKVTETTQKAFQMDIIMHQWEVSVENRGGEPLTN